MASINDSTDSTRRHSRRRRHIEIYTDRRRKGRYRVVAANGRKEVPSQAYSRRRDAKRAAVRLFPSLPVVQLP